MTAEELDKRLKFAQKFLEKNPLPPRKDPKDVVQCASTQRLLSMTDEELEVYRNREIDLDKALIKDFVLPNGEMNPKYQRIMSPEEFIKEDGLRKSRSNNLAQIERDPIYKASTSSSASDERKELARQAFTCTPPAELSDSDKERLTKLNKITEYKGPVHKESKPGLFDKISHFFKSYAPTQERHSYAELQEILNKEKK